MVSIVNKDTVAIFCGLVMVVTITIVGRPATIVMVRVFVGRDGLINDGLIAVLMVKKAPISRGPIIDITTAVSGGMDAAAIFINIVAG